MRIAILPDKTLYGADSGGPWVYDDEAKLRFPPSEFSRTGKGDCTPEPGDWTIECPDGTEHTVPAGTDLPNVQTAPPFARYVEEIVETDPKNLRWEDGRVIVLSTADAAAWDKEREEEKPKADQRTERAARLAIEEAVERDYTVDEWEALAKAAGLDMPGDGRKASRVAALKALV